MRSRSKLRKAHVAQRLRLAAAQLVRHRYSRTAVAGSFSQSYTELMHSCRPSRGADGDPNLG